MPRIALYQPDIAQNVGSFIRLCACLNLPLDIIEPCGFPFDMRRIKQSAMDYVEHVDLHRHSSWQAYLDYCQSEFPLARLCLLTTKASTFHHEVAYQKEDILLMGRESAGVPEDVHKRVDIRVKIPLAPHARSFNVVSAATIVIAEALNQTQSWPS